MTGNSANVDPQFVTIGETLASLSSTAILPLRYARTLEIGIGGAESNVAIGVSRLGLRSAWLGRVGADEFGQLVHSQLRAEGIDVHAIVDPIRPTALMIKSRRSSEITGVSYYRSASAGSALCVEDIDDDLIRRAEILHVTGITPALSSTAREAIHHAIQTARSANVLVSVDFNYRRALWPVDQAGEEFRSLTKLSDIVFASASEAEIAVGSGEPPELLRRLAALGPSQVIIKLGARGALGLREGEVYAAAPVSVVAVDPVGAGDAFAAGYLASLIKGETFAECMAMGARLGAFAVSVQGDWEGLPTMSELLTYGGASDAVLR
jgi:2-dehydro-3-deoxygluconokinase